MSSIARRRTARVGWLLGSVCGLLACLTLGTASSAPAQQVGDRTVRPRLDSLERRARVDSNDAVVHYELAMGYWRAKRWDDAKRSLDDAVALAPQYAEAYLALAALPLARGERYWKQVEHDRGKEGVIAEAQAAERYYRRAFLVNPMVDLGILGHVDEGSYLRQGPFVLKVWWLGSLSKGMNRFADGQYDRAFELLSSLLADQRAGAQGANLPDRVLWYHGLAAAHLQRYDDAIGDFALLTGRAVAEAGADEVGTTPLKANDYRYALATVLYLAGRYDQAAPTFRRALEFDISLFPAHVQLARMSEARQEWEEAVRERRAAIDADPDDPGLVTDLGVTLLRAGRLEDASEAFSQAMGAAPRDARVPYLAGVVAMRLNRMDAARVAFGRFLQVAPSRFAPQIAEVRDQLRAMDAAP